MSKDLKNKIAIITGGASGIGLAIAEKFVENNSTTIIIGRNEDKLKAAKGHLGKLCYALPFDLNNLAGMPKIVNQVVGKHKKVDILVNNAGINLKKEFTEVTDEDFQRISIQMYRQCFPYQEK